MISGKAFKQRFEAMAIKGAEGGLTDDQLSGMGAVEALGFLNNCMHTIVCEMLPALQDGTEEEFYTGVADLMGKLTAQAMKMSANAEGMVKRSDMGEVTELVEYAIHKLDQHIETLMAASEDEDSPVRLTVAPKGSGSGGYAIPVASTSEALN